MGMKAMDEAVLDGRMLHSRAALHEALAHRLALPEHYGANLDALYDCLTQPHAPPLRLRVLHPEALHAQLGGYAGALERMLRDAAAQNDSFVLLWPQTQPHETPAEAGQKGENGHGDL